MTMVALEIPGRPEELVEYRIYGGGTMWEDAGCDLAPRCLECPFEKCRYDYHGGEAGMQTALRRDRVVALTREGLTAREIADECGVSLRAVFRLRSGR